MPQPSASTRRIERELQTLRVMIGLYCHAHHGGAEPCAECGELWSYAEQRVARCPFRADKPTCANCPVHCFKPEQREQIRVVMRYAGPRMVWRHPVLSLLHLLDGKRKPPAARRR